MRKGVSNLETISITALRILLMKIFPASEPAFSPEKRVHRWSISIQFGPRQNSADP